MDTVKARCIPPPERRRLRRWKRGRTNQVNSCRARVILLSSGRVGNREIAQRVGYSPQWVRIIIHRFNAGGLAGIEWWPYFHGRRGPQQFTADLVEQIAEVRPLAAAETHRHDAMVAGQTAGIPGCAEDHRRDQPGMAPLSAAALPGPLAAHEDLERVERPGVLAEIPPLAAALPQAARRRAATVRGRIWPVESSSPNTAVAGREGRSGWSGCGRLTIATAACGTSLRVYDLETGRLFGRFTESKTWKDWLSFSSLASPPLPEEGTALPRHGQLQAAPEGGSPALGQGEQRCLCLHADERLVAEPHRVPLHRPPKVRPEQLGPRRPRRPTGSHRKLPPLAQRTTIHNHPSVAAISSDAPPKQKRESHSVETALALLTHYGTINCEITATRDQTRTGITNSWD